MMFFEVISNSWGLSKALHFDEKLIINFNEVGVPPSAEKMPYIFKQAGFKLELCWKFCLHFVAFDSWWNVLFYKNLQTPHAIEYYSFSYMG